MVSARRRPRQAGYDRQVLRVLAAAALAAGLAWPSFAGGPAEPEPEDLVNLLYALDHGFGGYSVEGRSVQVYRIPFSVPLVASDGDRWGLRLLLPTSFGVYDLRAATGAGDLAERVETVTVSPGLELDIPISGRWRLRPFAELGVVTALGDTPTQQVIRTGARWNVDLGGRAVSWLLGGAITYATADTPEGVDDDLTTGEIGVEAAFGLGFDVAGATAVGSVYAIGRRFDDLEFRLPDLDTFHVAWQYEVGLGFGTDPPHRVLGVALPRIGLGYRFGDGLEGWRLSFGFPF